MVRIAEEYATALLKLAEGKGSVDQVYHSVVNWLDKQSRKAGILVEEMPDSILKDFMEYLIEKDRLEYAQVILERFRDLALDFIGVIRVEVISADDMTEEQLGELQRRLILRSGKRVHITHRVDSSLIAGIRLIADGIVMDTSIKGQLADIREKLYNGGVFYPWMQ